MDIPHSIFGQNKQSPTTFKLQALFLVPEASWNAELSWKYMQFQLRSIAQRCDGGIPVCHFKTKKTILIQAYDDLHCMDTPSVSGLVGGNEVGSTFCDSFIDGIDRFNEKKFIDLDIGQIKKLEVTDEVNKIGNLLNGQYKFDKVKFNGYCKFAKFPKYFLLLNGADVVDDDVFFERNPDFNHFEWYQLQSMDPTINDIFKALKVVPLLPKI